MNKLNTYQKMFSAFFIGLLALWVFIQFSGTKDGNVNFAFSFLFGLVPLFGGLIGMIKSKVWGGLKSALGRAVFFLSLGLVCWGVGETIWSYYNFFRDVAAPYPSLADVGFAPSIFFWVIGTWFLAHASGAWLVLKRSWHAKVYVLVAILALTALSYYLLIDLARDGVLVPSDETALKTVLDIVYPLGDFLAAIFAFIVITLSFKYLGGMYRRAIAATLVGLGLMYAGDVVFSYTTTVGSYYNADWGDMLLATGLFLLTFGVLGLSTKPVLPAVAATPEAPSPENIAPPAETTDTPDSTPTPTDSPIASADAQTSSDEEKI